VLVLVLYPDRPFTPRYPLILVHVSSGRFTFQSAFNAFKYGYNSRLSDPYSAYLIFTVY